MNEASSSQSKVLRQVAGYIEKATRFDGNDVSAAVPEIEAEGVLNFQLVQQVHITVNMQQTTGRLPSHADGMHNAETAETELRKRLASTNAKLPDAISRWVNEDDGSYLRLLPTHIVKLPKSAGHEWKCHQCYGIGKVDCTQCQRGRVPCTSCKGSCKVDCNSCSGRGKKRCTSCNGDGSTIQYNNAQTQYVSCQVCYGSGAVSCYNCNFSGRVRCSACFGNGDLECQHCSGSMRVSCPPCSGAGWFNQCGHFNIEIKRSTSNHEVKSIDKTSADLMAQIDVRNLLQYGDQVHYSHELNGLSVRTSYTLKIPYQKAELQAKQQHFTIYGFGTQAEVFDYQNLVGHMLQGDLNALREALISGKRSQYSWQSNVLDALGDFTRSELNLVIAEELVGTKASADPHKTVEAKFSGMVSSDYIANASQSFQSAISQIYRAKVGQPTLALLGIALILSAILSILVQPTHHWIATSMLTFTICGLTWVLAKIYAQTSITRQFEDSLGKRILNLSKQASNIKNWNRRFWLWLAICSLGGPLLVRYLSEAMTWLNDWLARTL